VFTFIEMNQEHCMKYFLCLLFLCCTQYAHAQGKLRSDLKGNVQAVVKNMEMMGTRGDTIHMKTTLKYDENKNLVEETVFFADATAVNHKVIYNYNSRDLMTNKTRYMQATNMDNGIIADIYEYDDMDRIVKEKTTSSRQSDSIVYWYSANTSGDITRYSTSTFSRGDTTVTVKDPRGNIIEVLHKGTNRRFTYQYDEHDNLIEETTGDITGKIKTRTTTAYNIDQMPVEVKQYDGNGKLMDESTNAYTNMDEQGNYLKETCMRNGKLGYTQTTDILYRQ
jgi:YD repeat-containing protein